MWLREQLRFLGWSRVVSWCNINVSISIRVPMFRSTQRNEVQRANPRTRDSLYSLTHSWRWALLEKLPIVQPLKKFSAFYGTRGFITVFTRALHWSLSWARSIQSTPSHPISIRPILILSTHLRLGLPSGHLPSGFPTNILHAFLIHIYIYDGDRGTTLLRNVGWLSTYYTALFPRK
jgi:hypothetical protein